MTKRDILDYILITIVGVGIAINLYFMKEAWEAGNIMALMGWFCSFLWSIETLIQIACDASKKK